MKLEKVSKALAAALMIAAPILLAAPGTALAKKPGNRPGCAVGTAAYPTIQSAVNDVNCSTIGVPAGTFHENVTIGRSVSIRGEGPGRTVIDGSWNPAAVFFADGRRPDGSWDMCDTPPINVTLEGMTLTGGTNPPSPLPNRNGGGIATFWVDLTVDNVMITGNSADWHGGGIASANGRVTVKNSVITNNTAYGNCGSSCPPVGGGGGGIRGAGCPNVIHVYDSEISNNVSYLYGGGISIYAGGALLPALCPVLEVKDSLVTGNTAASANGGGGIFHDYTNASVRSTTVTGNAPDNIKVGPNPCTM
jgi:hypothetical protein